MHSYSYRIKSKRGAKVRSNVGLCWWTLSVSPPSAVVSRASNCVPPFVPYQWSGSERSQAIDESPVCFASLRLLPLYLAPPDASQFKGCPSIQFLTSIPICFGSCRLLLSRFEFLRPPWDTRPTLAPIQRTSRHDIAPSTLRNRPCQTLSGIRR